MAIVETFKGGVVAAAVADDDPTRDPEEEVRLSCCCGCGGSPPPPLPLPGIEVEEGCLEDIAVLCSVQCALQNCRS